LQTQILSEESNKRKLHVEIGLDEMQPYFEEALVMFREEAQVQGFRKGKAPKDVILKKFGDQINAEALPVIVEDFYKQALEATKTDAIEIGQIDNVNFKKDLPLSFDVTVEIMPAYELPNYKGLKIQKEVHEVKDEEIQSTLEQLRENYSTTKEADEAAAGNFVTCDIQVLDHSGVPIIGKKYTDRRIPLTTKFVGQDMIDGLIGAKRNESRNLRVARLGDEIKDGGDHEHFMITVKKIEEVQLPALDDEFAKDVGMESLEKLKADVTENLHKRWQDDAARQLTERIIDEVIKQNDIPSPEPLIDNVLQRIASSLQSRLKKGQTIEPQYVTERYRPSAIRDVKWMLAKKKILQVENLSLTDSDFQAYREKTAKLNNVTVDKINLEFKTETERKNFEDYLLEEKLFKWIESQSEIEEIPDTQKTEETAPVA
jgi:trigger factor